MKRWMWFVMAAVAVVIAGATLATLPKEQEWTTTSPEALVAFNAAMDAQMMLYFEDAEEHIKRAVELDPDFVIAKLMSIDSKYRDDEEAAKALWDEVLATDTSRLTQREQFFIERSRAYREERFEDIPKIVDEYLAKNPNDPYILNQKAQRAFALGNYAESEPLYQALIEISPNWVIAYNQLGYINMMRGRFAEAEEYFKSYRFIAPDQANPHDSLGELFITMGRYDEAEETLEKALEIKPDFWASWQHLALMKSFAGDLDGARQVIDRARVAGLPEEMLFEMECMESYTGLRNAEAWQEILDSDSKCVEEFREGFSYVTTHFAAIKLGDYERAVAMEDKVTETLLDYESRGVESRDIQTIQGALDHMQGVRFALEGNYENAEEMLRAADERLTYVEAGTALYKLFNRMMLAEVLFADGRDAAAHGLLTSVRGVNPVMVAEFEETGLKVLGLERG